MTRFLTALPLVLAGGLTALPAQAFDVSAMTDDERAAFRSEIRDYLLENPEIIMEAVDALEAKQAQAQQSMDLALVQANRDAIFNDGGQSWVGGNPEGDVTLVEFIDYRCGYCRRAHEEVAELIDTDGNIRFVVKEFPILGEDSLASSQFAIAARMVAGDDAYKAVHDTLITLNAGVTDTVLRRIAETLELDADAILAKMESPEVEAVIAETRNLARKLQISGTPSFVLGDQMLRGYLPLDAMRGVVEQVREQG